MITQLIDLIKTEANESEIIDLAKEIYINHLNEVEGSTMADSINLWNAIVSFTNKYPSLGGNIIQLESTIKELAAIIFQKSVKFDDEFMGIRLLEMYSRLLKLFRLGEIGPKYFLYMEKTRDLINKIKNIRMLNNIVKNKLHELSALLALEYYINGEKKKELSMLAFDCDFFASAIIEEIDTNSMICRKISIGEILEMSISESIKIQLAVRYIDWLLYDQKKLIDGYNLVKELFESYPRNELLFLSFLKALIALKMPIEADLFDKVSDFSQDCLSKAAELVSKQLGPAKTMNLVSGLPIYSKITITLTDAKLSIQQKIELIDILLKSAQEDGDSGDFDRCIYQIFEAADKIGDVDASLKLYEISLKIGEKTSSKFDLDIIKRRIFDCLFQNHKIVEAKQIFNNANHDDSWIPKLFKLALLEGDQSRCLELMNKSTSYRDEMAIILQDFTNDMNLEVKLLELDSLSEQSKLILLYLIVERDIFIDGNFMLEKINTLKISDENAQGIWTISLIMFNRKNYSMCKCISRIFQTKFAIGEDEIKSSLVLQLLCAGEFTEPDDLIILSQLEEKHKRIKKRSFIKLETEELPKLIQLAQLRLLIKLGQPFDSKTEIELEILLRLTQLFINDPQTEQSMIGKLLKLIILKCRDDSTLWDASIPLVIRTCLEGEHFMRQEMPIDLIILIAKKQNYPMEER
jgi:hypothetical protein